MKNNRSLALSCALKEFKQKNTISFLESVFPSSIFDKDSDSIKKTRNRVFTPEKTLMTMVLTAIQEDKSLKNSVMLSHTLHRQERRYLIGTYEEQLTKEKQEDLRTPRKAGRPKKYDIGLPKSLEKDISLNTAAYSKARGRLPLKLVKSLLAESRIADANNNYSHWHGYRVFIGDGTYLQMQDTQEIRQNFEVKHNGKSFDGYPQALLEVIIERGTGQVYSFSMANRHVSELSLIYPMISDLPQGSILLLDDYYNCFEIIAKSKREGIELLFPSKRVRNYEVVETFGKGDEIIRIKTPKNRSKWLEVNEKAGKHLLRRISCKSPDGKEYVLMTTVLDKEVPKEDIQLLYLSRWDIEISIREIKTIMDINILRSRTPDMALKELTVALATYNLIRKIIYASTKDLPFSPKRNFIYQFHSYDKDELVDKKGRVYNRWSPGRRGDKTAVANARASKKRTKQNVSKEI